MFNISSPEFWILLGCLFILIEFTKLPGIGFLFLGLGSLTNAILTYNYPFALEHQYTIFGLISFLWMIILWWPLKKYIYQKHEIMGQFEIIGSEVEVFNNISPGELGQVKWSGTIMNAKLDENEQEAALTGQKIYVHKVLGNVLICRKIKP